jgi:stage V sporulation protein G
MSEPLNFKIERLYRLESDGAIKAFADVAVNDAILLKGLRIVKGEKGLFVSMPKVQGKDQKWYEIIRLMTKEIRAQVSRVVLEGYKQEA